MAQADALINALKNVLKARGITYAQLAKGLALSEASVKRIFAERSFTLERLDQVCTLLGLQISDLARMVVSEQPVPSRLSVEQEAKLVADPRLLLVAVHALHQWTLEQIVDSFALTRAECIRLLARLDKLGILDLLPNNRIRVRVAPDFTWLPGGPIQQYFRAQLRNDFFNSHFDQPGEKMILVSGTLSEESNTVVQRAMNRIRTEFLAAHHQDLGLPLERRNGTALIVALRPWTPPQFRELRRPPKD
ncbi:XRE family transcription regulator protein [Herbaspirillum frisingense GSF30]|uniref:XRE family transcription regulator protein n=1 Tax=Herbaspirillum frisingense GSF30 TaxID=864073 RepID=A0AAI9IIK6_9BURK|nr:helix-turn-helix transcriptional regulator [Herbaspirillum frisingense]EOA06690.1 XRE family transcription regulator protein [Herbaspirillum frisingense GSF30]